MIDVKRMLPIAVALLAAAGQPVLAEEAPAATEQPGSWFPGTFTGTVALTNDYIFRGISQTDHNPAIQGSINYTLDTGFYGTSVYGGVWGSNLDFNDDAATNNNGAHLELDWTFGFTGNILDTGIGYTLGAIYYNYPGARNGLSYDYWEFAPALSYNVTDWLRRHRRPELLARFLRGFGKRVLSERGRHGQNSHSRELVRLVAVR